MKVERQLKSLQENTVMVLEQGEMGKLENMNGFWQELNLDF